MNNIKARLVLEKDRDLLFEWINDSEVRKWSFNNEIISYEDHKSWFNRILNDKSILCLIFEHENKPFGTVRFEKRDKSAILNYLISRDSRGQGKAKLMLKFALKRLKHYWEKMDVFAYTLTNNIASKKSLEKSGFKLFNNKNNKACYICRLK